MSNIDVRFLHPTARSASFPGVGHGLHKAELLLVVQAVLSKEHHCYHPLPKIRRGGIMFEQFSQQQRTMLMCRYGGRGGDGGQEEGWILGLSDCIS